MQPSLRVVGVVGVTLMLAAACGRTTSTSSGPLPWTDYGSSQDGRTLHLIAIGSECRVGKPWARVTENSVSVQINISEATANVMCTLIGVPLRILLHIHKPLGARGLAGCVTAYPNLVMTRCRGGGQYLWRLVSKEHTFSLS